MNAIVKPATASITSLITALAAALPAAFTATFAVGALAASPGPATASLDAVTVFQCSTSDGRTVFSDEPCVGAPHVRVWKPQRPAAGIAHSSAPSRAVASAPQAAEAPRQDPFVDCRRRGGQFELAARICRLPDDAAQQMFDPN